jgi:uncharacterized protein
VSDVLRDMVADALPRKARPMPRWKIEFYRQCRLWHGYLSAFAFLSLMFFSLTGLLLNHPEWLKQEEAQPQETRVTVSHDAIAAAMNLDDKPRALAALLSAQKAVGGVYASGELEDGEAYLRFEGVSGNASAVLDIKTGATEITTRKADAVTIINDLHRGKNAGAAWKWLIDISAVIFLVLSLVGYILFFSLRHRLVQTMALTVISLGALVGIFVLFVP